MNKKEIPLLESTNVFWNVPERKTRQQIGIERVFYNSSRGWPHRSLVQLRFKVPIENTWCNAPNIACKT